VTVTVLHESLRFRALEMPCGCCERGTTTWILEAEWYAEGSRILECDLCGVTWGFDDLAQWASAQRVESERMAAYQ
jgi:hypothetical protein